MVSDFENDPPMAEAGIPIIIPIPHDGDPALNAVTIDLDGTASDGNGDNVSCLWNCFGEQYDSCDVTFQKILSLRL